MTTILVIIAVILFAIMIQMNDLVSVLEDLAAYAQEEPKQQWDFDIQSKDIRNGEFVDDAED